MVGRIGFCGFSFLVSFEYIWVISPSIVYCSIVLFSLLFIIYSSFSNGLKWLIMCKWEGGIRFVIDTNYSFSHGGSDNCRSIKEGASKSMVLVHTLIYEHGISLIVLCIFIALDKLVNWFVLLLLRLFVISFEFKTFNLVNFFVHWPILVWRFDIETFEFIRFWAKESSIDNYSLQTSCSNNGFVRSSNNRF